MRRRAIIPTAHPTRVLYGAAGLLMACLVACTGGSAEPPATPAAAAPPAAPSPPAAPDAAASPVPPATQGSSARRLVAIGDLHGDLDNALAVLSMTGLVSGSASADAAWTGGDAVLVQTGDTVDRGPDSKAVLELVQRLQQQAPADGGRVVALLGNHEVMNLAGDLRYVHPGDTAAFGGAAARAAAFGADAPLGGWLRTLDAVAVVDDTVFAHGGVTRAMATLGVDVLNARIRKGLGAPATDPVFGPEGPLWYRGYFLADEALACDEAAETMATLGVRRMVVGHTTQKTGRVASRCGGAVLAIDTGISDAYGGNLAALVIEGDDARAVYPPGPSDLPDPAP